MLRFLIRHKFDSVLLRIKNIDADTTGGYDRVVRSKRRISRMSDAADTDFFIILLFQNPRYEKTEYVFSTVLFVVL